MSGQFSPSFFKQKNVCPISSTMSHVAHIHLRVLVMFVEAMLFLTGSQENRMNENDKCVK